MPDDKKFHLEILSSEQIIYQGQVISLVVPATNGYLGVLVNHAPLFAQLIKGKISIKEASGSQREFLLESKGFIEVLHNNVAIILVKP